MTTKPPDGSEWCQWCSEYPTEPGEPCDHCQRLGAVADGEEFDSFPRDIDALCQMMANATEMENTTIWGTRLGCCAVAVALDELYTGPRIDPATGERITTACARLAAHWPGTTERRVQAVGRAALAGIADLIEPDTPTGVLKWCIRLGANMARGRDARRWFKIARRLRWSLADLKRAAGLKPPAPAPEPELVKCPECGAMIDASECKH